MLSLLRVVAWALCVAAPPTASYGDAPRTPAFRLHFRAARSEPGDGFTELSRSPRPPVFVAQDDSFGAAEILRVNTHPVNELIMKVSPDVAARLRAERPELMAVLDNDRLAAVGRLEFDEDTEWNLRLVGLERLEAQRIGWMLSDEANTRLGVSIALVTSGEIQPAGSTVEMFVYLVGAQSVGSYQFVLETLAARRGWMRRDEVRIDGDRKDFLFHGLTPQITLDQETGKVGAAIEAGSVSAEGKSLYIGSVRFRTSEDASGTFTVQVQRSPDTFVKDKDGNPILFNHGSAVLVFREPVTPRLQK